MNDHYVPYETLARAEIEDMLDLGGVVSTLSLDPARAWALREILADTFARGIEMGFAMSDFTGDNPITAIEAYNAGVADGEKNG